jgi:hypothetical protein
MLRFITRACRQQNAMSFSLWRLCVDKHRVAPETPSLLTQQEENEYITMATGNHTRDSSLVEFRPCPSDYRCSAQVGKVVCLLLCSGLEIE